MNKPVMAPMSQLRSLTGNQRSAIRASGVVMCSESRNRRAPSGCESGWNRTAKSPAKAKKGPKNNVGPGLTWVIRAMIALRSRRAR